MRALKGVSHVQVRSHGRYEITRRAAALLDSISARSFRSWTLRMLISVSRAWFWIAFSIWAAVLVAMLLTA